MSKINLVHLFLFFWIFSIPANARNLKQSYSKDIHAPEFFSSVNIPEVYELSNIILSLTNYGLDDPYEIHKGTKYYQEVLSYFKGYSDHAIFKKANFSRAEWESFLSFRTDAVAFGFDSSGKLVRQFKFKSMPGQSEFENYLSLVQDFCDKSDFRKFYQTHLSFYSGIINNYSKYNRLPEVESFLDSIFGPNLRRHIVFLSPLVGRMNCHRSIGKIYSADFIDVPDRLLDSSSELIIDTLQQAIDIHTIFTEFDHGYVDPFTKLMKFEIRKSFNPKKWETNSGYDGIGCFNEYLTWGLYDIFTKKYFEKFSHYANLQWHFQNANRGFFASSYFSDSLIHIINLNKSANIEATVKKQLNWCRRVQKALSLPTMLSNSKEQFSDTVEAKIVLKFSEPIQQRSDSVSFIVSPTTDKKIIGEKEIYTIPASSILWHLDYIEIPIPTKSSEFAITINWWGVKFPIISAKGVMILPGSTYYILRKM